MNTSNLTKLEAFDGEFSFLPFAAHIEHGEVPLFPNEADFHMAVTTYEHEQSPAALWRLEAVRWRLHHQGHVLDLGAINRVVAKRIYEAVI